jgi:pimeloyl-ACP methyl ester carboxylesterase
MPFADAGGYRVYYEEHGSGDPLLLVNGLGADHTAWQLQTNSLQDSYRVLVFDNPGVGRTTGPGGAYTSPLFADVAAGLLARLGIDRAHVVGASMGGIIAQQLALRHPETVRSLSLHCTWGRADAYLAALLRSWQAIARAVPRIELVRQLWLFVFTIWWFNDRQDKLAELERVVLEDPYPQSPEDFCDQADACIAHDALDRLGEIAAPTYISVGDRDLLAPAHHSYAIKQRIPHAQLRVWQKMGHAPFWEIPEQFNQRQLEFLKEAP